MPSTKFREQEAGQATNRERNLPWVPAGFCAFLSLMSLGIQVGFQSNAWVGVFLPFLPLCFYFSGVSVWHLRQEINSCANKSPNCKANSPASRVPSIKRAARGQLL